MWNYFELYDELNEEINLFNKKKYRHSEYEKNKLVLYAVDSGGYDITGDVKLIIEYGRITLNFYEWKEKPNQIPNEPDDRGWVKPPEEERVLKKSFELEIRHGLL